MLGLSLDGVNDTITALLTILVAAILRAIWSLQQRVSRLEGVDEMRERLLDTARGDEPTGERGE